MLRGFHSSGLCSIVMDTYDPHTVERDVQSQWRDADCFRAPNKPGDDKFYCLAMFPYPSGQLHMGHVRCYTLADVINRFRRLEGHVVMQPMGWDAFGLPAENAAIKNGIPPATWTRSNIDNMKGQMLRLGFGMDWSREFATCDPRLLPVGAVVFREAVREGPGVPQKARS